MPHPPTRPIPAGSWALRGGRALSLHPRQPSRLRLVQGRAWVTVTERHSATQDHLLRPGDSLTVPPRSHVVLEPWCAADPVAFEWERLAATARLDWDAAVRTPGRDLAQALAATATAAGSAALALARLLVGLGRWAGAGRSPTPAHANCYKNNS